jgi:PAS domain S-box-containing protein
LDFLSRLFDTTTFPPRWTCGQWSSGHGWLHILSDIGIWSAYFAIPVVLATFIWRRREIPFRKVLLLFVAFILLCGTTHLMEAVIFWWPAYRLAGVLKLLTALVSWVTVLALVRVAPAVLAMRTPEELEREVAARTDAERRLKEMNAELERRVEQRTAALAHAVEAEAEQRERLRTTLASIGDAVISTDRNGSVAYLNSVAESLTGWTHANAVGLPLTQVFRIINESTRQVVENPAIRALRDGAVVGLANHTVLVGRDGTERPIDDSAAPIRDKDGEIVGCVLVFRDIGEKRRLENEQREAQARVVATLESVTDGFIRYDREWRIVYANAEAERINKLTRSEMLGRIVWEVFPALIGSILETEFRRAVTEQVTVEFENYYEPFGRWYSLNGYPTADGGLTTFIRDITEQKLSQEALQRSEARLRRVFESNVVGMIRWDLDRSLILDANDTFLRMSGYTRDDVSAGRLNFRDMTPAEWTSRNEEGIRAIRVDGHSAPYEKEYIRKDGSRLPLIIAGTRFDDSASEGMSLLIDISHSKQSEREVARLAAESERQRRLYETVLSNTPDFVYVFSLDHKVVYANDALIRMWGLGQGAIGKTFLEIGYEPWHAEMHNREIDTVRTTRQPIRGDVPFVGTSGRRQYDYIFVPVFGADGEVEAVAGTTRDVTERKEAEERQAFLVMLADTLRPLSDPTLVQVEASRILGEHLGANRVVYFEIRGDEYVIEHDYTSGVRQLAGRYPVAAFGSPLLALLLDGSTVIEADATAEPDRPPGERAAFAAIEVRGHVDVPLVKSGRFVAGLTVQVSDRRDWTRQEVALIEDTAERTWAAVERVKAEAALRQSEERRRLALDAAELGAWHIDLATNAFTTDERFRIIFAGTIEAITYEQAFAAIHTDDQDRIRGAVAAATRSDDPARYAEEYRVVHPDGSIRWVFAKGRAIFDVEGTGRLVSFDGTIADITARKFIEEERERLVGQLRDADRRKDEFLATLAHELRNPLAPVKNSLELMKRASGSADLLEQACDNMERQVGQMVRLIDDLLDVSRITRDKLELKRDLVELASVVHHAVEACRPLCERARHELHVTLPQQPIYLNADPMRLAQVIGNLLTNSCKYTEPGGRIWLTAERQGNDVAVSVKDTGIGIPRDMLTKVFDMFAQVDRSLERSAGGLGIGLSLVKRLVELHDGTVTASSEGQDRGSEFVVRLPVLIEKPQPQQEPPSEPTPSLSRRILVVDDNRDSSTTLAMLLRLIGNETQTAHDGVEAVEKAAAFRPDVILLDIGLPKMNGYAACRAIRELPGGKDIVMIALTGWGQDDDRRKSKEAGFDDHMVKPVDHSKLLLLLASLSDEPGREQIQNPPESSADWWQ